MLSRMMGRSRILFLDDDITAPNRMSCERRADCWDATTRWLHIGGFPDHSVVCHANKLLGGSQQSLISASALFVEAERCD
jgi:hypothetical protein